MPEFTVVLVEPQIQGNIGAVARAMMNFGEMALRIVGECEITEEARQRAVHAQPVLDHATFHPDLEQALQGFPYRIATTGITPDNEKRHLRSHLELREFSNKMLEIHGPVALVFGRENYGLSNPELQLCDVVVSIPTSDEYPILNLSHAVSTVLYQLFTTRRDHEGVTRELREAPLEDMDRLHDRIGHLLEIIEYPEHKRENTGIMIRRIIGRSFVTRWEYHTLMGVLSHIERKDDRGES